MNLVVEPTFVSHTLKLFVNFIIPPTFYSECLNRKSHDFLIPFSLKWVWSLWLKTDINTALISPSFSINTSDSTESHLAPNKCQCYVNSIKAFATWICWHPAHNNHPFWPTLLPICHQILVAKQTKLIENKQQDHATYTLLVIIDSHPSSTCHYTLACFRWRRSFRFASGGNVNHIRTI